MFLFPIEGPEALALAVVAADLGLPGTPDWAAVTVDPELRELLEGAHLAARVKPGCWKAVTLPEAVSLGENGHLIAAR